ncbi:MAG: hypothetical protein MUE65_03355, partial [Methanomassiliicoccales archaeon]|nr:hypothetical protein [Methanomassiliicoccales archaeon]
MVLLVTGVCRSGCYYCPLSREKKGREVVFADEMRARSDEDVLSEARSIGARGTGVTGGDPLVMSTKLLRGYIEPILSANLPNLQTIRIGTKAFSYWPYRFLTDRDSDELILLFEKIVSAGINLAIMAHFNHPVELSTEAVQKAIRIVRSTGAQIRTQSPILRHINDSPGIWAELWRKQVNLNCIPYYMFIA